MGNPIKVKPVAMKALNLKMGNATVKRQGLLRGMLWRPGGPVCGG